MQTAHNPTPDGHGVRLCASVLGARGRGSALRMIETSWLFGHEDVRLLDGGRAKWEAEGREYTYGWSENFGTGPDGARLEYRGGDTMFASMYAAYDALSPKMKEYLSGLTATHDGTRVFGPGTPVSVHPVITRHPDTGRRVIFVNTDFTSHINEVSRAESRAYNGSTSVWRKPRFDNT